MFVDLFQIYSYRHIRVDGLCTGRFGMPLRAAVVIGEGRRSNAQHALQHQTKPRVNVPVFTQTNLYILHRKRFLVAGVETAPRRDTECAEKTQAVRV